MFTTCYLTAVRAAFTLVVAGLLTVGCYSRPKVPAGNPLTCTMPDAGECPSKFECMRGICVPLSCTRGTDCPNGYFCLAGRCGVAPEGGDGGGGASGGDGSAAADLAAFESGGAD